MIFYKFNLKFKPILTVVVIHMTLFLLCILILSPLLNSTTATHWVYFPVANIQPNVAVIILKKIGNILENTHSGQYLLKMNHIEMSEREKRSTFMYYGL